MASDVNLKEIERKVFRSYFKDGLWDIYGALMLLGFSLAMVTGWDYLMLVFAVLAVALLYLRRYIVVPRLGQVKFSSDRQAKTKRSILIAVIIGTFTALIGMVFFVLHSTNRMPIWLDIWMEDYFLAAFGGMIALLVAISAYIVGVWRYYIYAGLTFMAFVLASILRPNDMEFIPILVAGGIILISGMVILTRFLGKYPKPSKEIGDA